LENLKIIDQYGNLKAISYKCVYPVVAPTTSEIELEYLKLIKNAENNLSAFRAKTKAQASKIDVKEKEPFRPLETGASTGGSGSSK
ncbi:MAG: hypothetical protein K2Q18_03390, partial [Bdellovibrionales bacterium]|nr:hypothetical protein [Bdellovibrionales bacterium]